MAGFEVITEDRIPPREMMRLGLGKMYCPNRKQGVIERTTRSSSGGTAVPIKP
jgi:hypothetical protein